MRVDGVGSNGGSGGVTAQAMDPVSKNLRAQIMDAQKQLQELAANKDMEPEEKMERRKEIQQRITELNAQLRQHEVELRQEKQQQMRQKAQSEQARRQEAKQKVENAPEGRLDTGLSKGGMEAMISAGRGLGQAKVQGSVASAMKGRANVLKSEIEHAGRGAAVEGKQESVADIEARLEDIAKKQAQSLKEAGRQIEEAGKDAREEREAEAEKRREEDVLGVFNEEKIGGKGSGIKDGKEQEEEKEKSGEDAQEEDSLRRRVAYRKVDVLL